LLHAWFDARWRAVIKAGALVDKAKN